MCVCDRMIGLELVYTLGVEITRNIYCFSVSNFFLNTSILIFFHVVNFGTDIFGNCGHVICTFFLMSIFYLVHTFMCVFFMSLFFNVDIFPCGYFLFCTYMGIFHMDSMRLFLHMDIFPFRHFSM